MNVEVPLSDELPLLSTKGQGKNALFSKILILALLWSKINFLTFSERNSSGIYYPLETVVLNRIQSKTF